MNRQVNKEKHRLKMCHKLNNRGVSADRFARAWRAYEKVKGPDENDAAEEPKRAAATARRAI